MTKHSYKHRQRHRHTVPSDLAEWYLVCDGGTAISLPLPRCVLLFPYFPKHVYTVVAVISQSVSTTKVPKAILSIALAGMDRVGPFATFDARKNRTVWLYPSTFPKHIQGCCGQRLNITGALLAAVVAILISSRIVFSGPPNRPLHLHLRIPFIPCHAMGPLYWDALG